MLFTTDEETKRAIVVCTSNSKSKCLYVHTLYLLIYCIGTCLCTARRNAHSGAVRTGALESPVRTHRLLRTRGVHVRRAAGMSYAIFYSTILFTVQCTICTCSRSRSLHMRSVEFSTVHSPYAVQCFLYFWYICTFALLSLPLFNLSALCKSHISVHCIALRCCSLLIPDVLNPLHTRYDSSSFSRLCTAPYRPLADLSVLCVLLWTSSTST